jgi:hypothetical protein
MSSTPFLGWSNRAAGRRARPSRPLTLEYLEERSTPATFLVSSLADAGPGTLRQAIIDANANPDPDVIVFDAPTTRGTIAASTTDAASSAAFGPTAFAITTPVTILGSGQTLTRDAAVAQLRFFYVAPTGDLTLQDVTLQNGSARGGDGGDGFSGGGGGAGLGGAILVNGGVLTVRNALFVSNTARGGDGGNPGAAVGGGGGGGGLLSAGVSVTLADGGAGGGPAGGAGGSSAGGSGAFGGGGGGGGAGFDGGAGGPFAGSGGSGSGARGGDSGFGGGGGGGQTAEGVVGLGGGFGGLGSTGGGGGGGAGFGGAIFDLFGAVNVIDSTFAGNVARGGDGGSGGVNSGGGGGGAGLGGAIFTVDGSTVVTNATLTGNEAMSGSAGPNTGSGSGGVGAVPRGSAVMNVSATLPGGGTSASTVLVNSVFSGNTGAPDAGNFAGAGTATLDASTPNLFNEATVGGAVDNVSGTFNGGGVLLGDPRLGPLQDNGGPTRTEALGFNSPALNAGVANVLVTTDQRGVARDAIPDLGAFEVQHPLAPVGVPVSPRVQYGPFPNVNADEAFVKGLYQSTLFRPGEPAGLANWVGVLQNHVLTREQVARGFYNSTENRTNQVTFFYRYFLGREPDPAGLNNWVTQLQSGNLDELQVMRSFILSPEFTGKNDNVTFVDTMYYAILGRPNDPAGFANWLALLNTGTLNRQQVLDAFVLSPEGVARLVNETFGAYLRHGADPATVNFWQQSLSTGARKFSDLPVSVLASDEFFTHASANVP